MALSGSAALFMTTKGVSLLVPQMVLFIPSIFQTCKFYGISTPIFIDASFSDDSIREWQAAVTTVVEMLEYILLMLGFLLLMDFS